MKKYDIDNLRVIKIETKNDVRYTICYYSKIFRTYIDVFTGQKIISTSPVEALTKYYNCAELYYRRGEGKGKMYITKRELLDKYTEINSLKKQEAKELKEKEETNSKTKQEELVENIDVNKVLEMASQSFFPKTGASF